MGMASTICCALTPSSRAGAPGRCGGAAAVFHSALVGCSDPLCGLRPELPPRPSGDALANRAFRVRRPTERRCERWRPALVRRPPAGRTSDVLPSSVIDQGDQAFERHLHMILEPDVIGDTTEGQV